MALMDVGDVLRVMKYVKILICCYRIYGRFKSLARGLNF